MKVTVIIHFLSALKVFGESADLKFIMFKSLHYDIVPIRNAVTLCTLYTVVNEQLNR